MNRAALLLVVATACGGSPARVPTRSTPAPAPQARTATPEVEPAPIRPPSAVGADAGTLPLAIQGLRLEWPRDFYVDKNPEMYVFLGKDHYSAIVDPADANQAKKDACWPALIDKLEGVYVPHFIQPIEIEGARLLHGVTVDEITKCMATIGEKRARAQPKDKRITALTLATFTQLPGPWVLWTRDASAAKAIGEVLATVSSTPNPLATLLATQPLSKRWYASALDYAWEVFGVSSLGAIFEYDEDNTDGPIAVRAVFADAATARLARQRLDKRPDTLAEQTAFGEAVPAMLARLHRMTITIEDRELVLRGTMRAGEASENGLGIFWGAPPVRRPLTAEERARLFRPLP